MIMVSASTTESLLAPPTFVIAELARKAAWDGGYRLAQGSDGAWLKFASTTVPGEIRIAAESYNGPWALAVTHYPTAAALWQLLHQSMGTKPEPSHFIFSNEADLAHAVDRVWKLSHSLPPEPLKAFQAATAGFPTSTEAERLVVQRIGQDKLRDALLAYWNGRCPLTGITDECLLRASHIVPWAACADDAQRLDVHNGILLSALWDAAFDAGLVTFADNGEVQFSPRLSDAAKAKLVTNTTVSLTGMADQHLVNMAWHRSHIFVAS